MAIQTITYKSSVYIPVGLGCCEDVYLCLTEAGAAKTTDGNTLQAATISEGRYLGHGGQPRLVSFENPRCEDLYQYTISYDDSILAREDLLTCADISEVFPYACTAASIINSINTLPDWVVDEDNVVTTIDVPTRQFDVDIPIIDRVNSISVGIIQLDFSALFDDTATDIDAYGATAAGGHTVTRAGILGGTTERVQILSTDANNIITAGTDNGNYLTCDDVNGCINIGPFLDGDGSQGDPFNVALSTDTDNALTSGTDTLLYMASYAANTDGTADSAAGPVDISGAGTVSLLTSTLLTLDNSGSTRTMSVLLNAVTLIQAVLETAAAAGPVWAVNLYEEQDGGGYVLVSSEQYGPFNIAAGTMAMPLKGIFNNRYVVAPGATLTLQYRLDVVTSVAGTPATSSAGQTIIDVDVVKVRA